MLGILVALGASSPGQAATGYWWGSQNTSSPTIYQTNLYYQGTAFSPPSVPAGATISTINFQWTMLDPPPSGLIYTVYVCQGTTGLTACALVSPNYSTQSYSGTTSAFAGYAATNSFHYAVAVLASSTYVLNPAKYSSYYRLQVNYTY